MRTFLLLGLALALILLAAWLMDLQRRLKWKASEGGRYPADVREGLALIDLAAEGVLVGREPTDGALEESGAAFSRFHRYLNQRNHTENNNRFALADRAAFYLYAIKLSALQHPDHNAWPLMASLRAGFIQPLRREIRASQDGWTQLAFITPALLARDVALAEHLYRKLPPKLARIALEWVQDTIASYKDFNHVPSSHRFLQALGVPLPSIPPRAEDPLTSEQRWAISVAVYPSYARDPRAALSEPLAPAVCRASLLRWWEVSDRDSAISILEWLLEQGHSEQLADELELLSTDELSPEKRAFLLGNESELREYLIVAFDLCRLVNVARSAHKAEYIDEGTAWHFILSAARKLHETYPSWSDMGDDYILGNRYFSGDHKADPGHRASVEWLQQSPSSPWRTIAWSDGPR
ncbi:MAG TPA: DUF1266 domain-containing protein [Polyangiaceae bacterium]|nr:DUF1266 domain-containing protein [Polyangiaceae bacterium]